MKDPLRSMFERLFSIDSRSLAVFRVSIGILWLIELCVRLVNVSAYYTDLGILPREKALIGFPETAIYSINMLSGDIKFQTAIFILAIVAALCMIIGRWTRPATVVTWLLCISIQSRNEMILYGADHLLRVLLFWAMFLPSGKRLGKYASVWTAGVLLQISYFYFFSALLKTGDEWRVTGTALNVAFQYDQLTGDWGRYLLQFPGLLRFLSISVFYMELVATLFLFFPFATQRIRTWTVLVLMIFHASIALTMELYLIPFANMAALLLFVPTQVWDLRRSAARATEAMTIFSRTHWLHLTVGVVLVAYVFIWNVGTVLPGVERNLPRRLGMILRIDQNWGFYAPRPFTDDGWWVFSGTTYDGLTVDAWSLELTPNDFKKPEVVSKIFRNEDAFSALNAHWMAHSILSLDETRAANRAYFLDFLCRRWNARWAKNHPIKEISMLYFEERTGAPLSPSITSPVRLASVQCAQDPTND